LKAVAEELARRGVVVAPTELVEGIRGLRGSEAIAKVLQRRDASSETLQDSPSASGSELEIDE
jgi:hypothetical protein